MLRIWLHVTVEQLMVFHVYVHVVAYVPAVYGNNKVYFVYVLLYVTLCM